MVHKLKSYYYYLKYILQHKYYVLLASYTLGIIWRGLKHDLSKFRPSEFFPYADYYFGQWKGKIVYEIKPVCTASLAYDIAWLKHKHRNEHHWQYWVTVNDGGELIATPIPLPVIKEMICDWYSAGRVQNNPLSVREWFESKKDSIILHQDTLRKIYTVLDTLEDSRR